LFFRNLPEDGVFARLKRAVSLEGVSANDTCDMIFDVAIDMIAEAERRSLRGDLWEIFYALAVAANENPLCRIFEKNLMPEEVSRIPARDLWARHKVITAVKSLIENDDVYQDLKPLCDYVPTGKASAPYAINTYESVGLLAEGMAAAETAEDMFLCVQKFYAVCGSGIFALNHAFKWDSSAKKLFPVADVDPKTLDSLIGYESQKKELLANTDSFLKGYPANNVLLYGDSGTGKSSSIRALLNEPDFTRRGLRMIELRQDQFSDIPDILALIRGRGCKFVIFMDDLSFEEFEVEYKYLKALIEGGLELKPENAVIYATSNKRHIIREVWGDRASSAEDVHGWDTMQEKRSLADRFGTTIWYPSADKTDYISMVRSIAGEFDVVFDESELENLAMQWELTKGAFTGRAARQFVCDMLRRRG
jgi:predicted AAA+ superfamily ATPase